VGSVTAVVAVRNRLDDVSTTEAQSSQSTHRAPNQEFKRYVNLRSAIGKSEEPIYPQAARVWRPGPQDGGAGLAGMMGNAYMSPLHPWMRCAGP